MSLMMEWRRRLENHRNCLREFFYEKLADVSLSGCVTQKQLTPEEALAGDFKAMPPGTQWGAKWDYCWFKGSTALPAESKGKRTVLRVDVGAESRVLINGIESGGRDAQHTDFLLSLDAKPGKEFGILIEGYGGHGGTPCGGGPVPAWKHPVPEPPAQQRTVGSTTIGIWHEDAYQLWLDVQTLIEVRDGLDQNSLRVAEIDQALRDFTLIADLELPRDEAMTTIRAARARLRPLLECTNGSTAPKLFCVGHSHIDVAWLWPLAETERKCARTFATQLALMDQYPEYKFLQSQPHLYQMTKELYPEIYERIKKAVKAGQWLPEGGMWVEADTNISGGESLIRQFIHGKRFYREELGVDSEMMWLPDVFGYSGAMPQIMDGCGIKYFATAKIFWAYYGGDPFPYNSFWWEGIDGSKVLCHLMNDYNSQTNPALIMQRWNERVQKDGIDARLVPFGWGDGGGGPTRDHLEFLRRQENLEGVPQTEITPPNEFFEREAGRNMRLPVYVGEIYYQCHRGTYTSQAKTKRGNRKSELALRDAEMWGAAARALQGAAYPAADIDQAWKGVLLNQFHDIIPGSSINRVYEEAEALYAKVISTARTTAESAARSLLREDTKSITVFNSLSWDRTDLVRLPEGFEGAAIDGKPLPVQKIDGSAHAKATLPSCGWITLKAGKAAQPEGGVKASAESLENEHLRITLNAKGEITSCIDKTTGREYAAGAMNSLRMYKDVPAWFDAWDIDANYKLQPVELPNDAQIEVIAEGPLAAVLRVRRTLGKSALVQDIRLVSGSRRVEFHTVIDWRERHKLLKVNFPTTIHANEAIHEIQFGHLRRPNHTSRQFDADRFEVSNHKWTALAEEKAGAAVLNDCKYGLNVEGGSINLTLLRSPLAPDATTDQGSQEFTYAFHAWNGSFFDSGIVREAYELNVPATTLSGAAETGSLFSLDASNVIIDTVKPAEDGSSDIIVRLYEAMHTHTNCTLATSLPVKSVEATNMLEDTGTPVTVENGAIALTFRPFEIKTLRMKV